jgi:hypothetical protein
VRPSLRLQPLEPLAMKFTREQCWVAQQEKDDIQAKFAEDRAQIQNEKEQLLTEKIGVKEAVTREILSVTVLE